ncbi:hypothetical protein [Enhygromyxa salina]|uniref:Saccharopine dehydrogenase n=1 Tax=Enhygromyxa salina TaxID=215803 RepID=A0A2S9YC84_9BACT|nr:hypothetical protein [Enhygromyxa salina]PRQ02724.1 hypothetical protein ENSA7_55530 [Enhygromyxa salina]
MSRILVIGGTGYYGARVVAQLARAHEVSIGSRSGSGDVVLDLSRPETFGALAGFELIINCSDSVNAPPDAAIAHILAHGGTWLEMGADPTTIERLLALDRPEANAAAKGTVILGVGVFPGISTVLARAVAERAPECDSIELGIRISPLSGAGPANCALMAESLFTPAFRWDRGQRLQSRTALGPGTALPFADGSARSINFALPDTALIRHATGVPTVIAHFALTPSWLLFNFAALAWVAWLLRVAKRPLAWVLTWQLVILRAWLLRTVESRVELVAIADRNTSSERGCWLSFEDGQQATALGVGAAVEAWLAKPDHRAGVFGVANYFELAEITAGLERCGDETAVLHWM